jgi:hypothetical protein
MKTYKVEVDLYGDIRWYNEEGQYHREGGPAVECTDGTKYWYKNDQLHREDGPAIEYPDGTNVWYINGRRHREDGPAIEHANGTKEWYKNGEQLIETEFNARNNVVEVSIEEIEKILGHKVKIVKG